MGFAAANPTSDARASYSAEPFVLGDQTMQQSMELVERKIRSGYAEALADPHQALRGWVGQVLMAAGKPVGIRARVQAILSAYSAKTLYAPDPHNNELVQSAVASLCLKPGLCLPLNDCDDKTAGGATCVLIAGIPVWIVKQNYGGGKQQHVLIGFMDDGGRRVLVDFSTEQMDARQVSDEVWVNPIAGMTPMTIGVGAPHSARAWAYESRHGKVWASADGGGTWIEIQDVGLGAAALPYVPVTGFSLHGGLRYRVQMLFTPADLLANDDVTVQYLKDQYGNDWYVDSIGPDGDTAGAVIGGLRSWTLQGIPKTDLVLASSSRYLNPSYTNISVQASSASAAPATTAPLATTGPKPPTAPMGVGTAVALAAGTAVVGGLGWAWWKRHHPRRAAYARAR